MNTFLQSLLSYLAYLITLACSPELTKVNLVHASLLKVQRLK